MVDNLFWFFLMFPLVISLSVKFLYPKKFSWIEFFLTILLTFTSVLIIVEVGKYNSMTFYEIINGSITEKQAVKKDCPSGWVSFPSSHCTYYRIRTIQVGQTCTVYNNAKTCTPNYETQYNYIFPWEIRYFLNTNINEEYEIERIDQQGSIVPERYDVVNIGDPASTYNPYLNYIKASKNTLFNSSRHDYEKFKDNIPKYPKIYDYYKVNRVIPVNINANDIEKLNDNLNKINSELGHKKQVNIILVITNIQDSSYANAIDYAWSGYNKNDVIIFIGSSNSSDIDWTIVHSWSKNDLFNVIMRDEILNLKQINVDNLSDVIYKTIDSYFERRPMEEFEYLKSEIDPPIGVLIFVFIVCFIVCPFMTYLFYSTNYM